MSRQAGFTLIEVLAAMALAALASLILAAATATLQRGWRAVAANGPEVAMESLRRHLAQMLPEAPDAAGFVGGPDSMHFLAASPDPGAPLVRVAVERRGGALVLITVPPEGGVAAERRLLKDVRAVEFAYLGAAGWTRSWDDPLHLPRLVRVGLGFADARLPRRELMAAPVVEWPALVPP
ncbi:prepilin-type N-terminal cleavage/methylation domain-containing protein [Magnetospirillum sp. UT-4]|uniref:prepilin-type N-terminal cleavage/methylation domain-containing protein n=1 Tax=Magnetospirillum sp. UT-4 TaxID=2681467 RepID=UPI00138513F0|nr:prepilin-type N-terminal cleavage/methylation domain-containing protein [Magnetospirillum sp. UT-4]CAA7621440.1 putative Type II secretion system protein J [Magnetospirillum sp. UT-4]